MRPTAAAKDGLLPDSGNPSIPSGRPTRAWFESVLRASSGSPVSWQAPPVITSLRPAWAA